MQDNYNYWQSRNMNYKNKVLRRRLFMEIKNYNKRYTIYMLVCNITGDTYYGSTCRTLKVRFSHHKRKRNCSAKIIIDRGNYSSLIPLETNLSYGS